MKEIKNLYSFELVIEIYLNLTTTPLSMSVNKIPCCNLFEHQDVNNNLFLNNK